MRGTPAAGRDAVPVADPDPAVDLGARASACGIAGLLPGRAAEARGDLGEPLLELGEQRSPGSVLGRIQGGQQRRRDLELDDGGARLVPGALWWARAAGAGSSAGEQNVLEAAVVVGEHHPPLAAAMPSEQGAGRRRRARCRSRGPCPGADRARGPSRAAGGAPRSRCARVPGRARARRASAGGRAREGPGGRGRPASVRSPAVGPAASGPESSGPSSSGVARSVVRPSRRARVVRPELGRARSVVGPGGRRVAVLRGQREGHVSVVEARHGAVEQPRGHRGAQGTDRDQHPQPAHRGGEGVDPVAHRQAVDGVDVADRQGRRARRVGREDHPGVLLGALLASLRPLRIERGRGLLDAADELAHRQLGSLPAGVPSRRGGRGRRRDRASTRRTAAPWARPATRSGARRRPRATDRTDRRPGRACGRGHRARPAQDRGDLVARELVELRAPIGAPGLRATQVVDGLQEARRGLALGACTRPHVRRQVLTGQRRRRQPLQGVDQPRAGRESVQLGREAGPDILVDAHEDDVRGDPRQSRPLRGLPSAPARSRNGHDSLLQSQGPRGRTGWAQWRA